MALCRIKYYYSPNLNKQTLSLSFASFPKTAKLRLVKRDEDVFLSIDTYVTGLPRVATGEKKRK